MHRKQLAMIDAGTGAFPLGKLVCSFFLLFFFWVPVQAQVIWSEDFSLPDGTTSDAGATAWTTDVSGANFASGGYLEVQSNWLSCNDSDGEVVWASEWIDISGETNVTVDMAIQGIGSLDFSGALHDYFRAYYRVDGGAEELFYEENGMPTNLTPSSCAYVSGDSIQVVIRLFVTGWDEWYNTDYVRISSAGGGPAAPPGALYARESGNWNSGTTWSTSLGGLPCYCTPTSTSDVRIGCGYVVSLPADARANTVVVYEGSSLRWTNNNVELSLYGDAYLEVHSGASLDQNGRGSAALDFSSAGNSQIIVNDATVGIDLDQINIRAGVQLNIQGAGRIDLDDSFTLHAASSVVNDVTGTFRINNDFNINATNSSLTNNETLTIGDNLDINNADNVTVTNNRSLNIQGDIDLNNSDGVVLNNAAGAAISVTGNDIELSENSYNFRINNYGSLRVTDDIKESPAGASSAAIYNYSGASLYLGHDMAEMDFRIYASYDNNVVSYNRAGNQSYIFEPQDSYWDLELAGSGRKRSISDLDINGDLLINGSAIFDVNNGNNDLTVAGSWVNTSAAGDSFDQGTELVTFDGDGNDSLQSTFGEVFYDLIIDNKTGPLTLKSNVSIASNGSVQFTEGLVNTTASALLIVEDNATSTAGNAISYVNGPVSKIGNDAFTFPVGRSRWAPIRYYAVSGATIASRFTATYHEDPAPNGSELHPDLNHVSSVEHWTLTRDVGTAVGNVAAYWKDADLSEIGNLSDLDLAVYNATNARWESASGTVSGGSAIGAGAIGDIVGSVTNFGFFAFASGNGSNPLPVELLLFEAQKSHQQVELTWETASELNNDYFVVERSLDGQNFEAVAQVKGAGTTPHLQQYATVDKNPQAGTSYYRLKQVDFDGAIAYSDLRLVRFDAPEQPAAIELSLYPNPAQQSAQTTLVIHSVQPGQKITLTVVDMLGHVLVSKEVNSPEHVSSVWNREVSPRLVSGIYTVVVVAQGQMNSQKLIVR